MPVAAPIAGGIAAGAAGALLSRNRGGGSGGTTTTVQNADPWAGVQPHLLNLFTKGEQIYNNGPFDYRANQSPFTRQAQDLSVQRATDPNSVFGRTQGLLTDTISGKYLSPDSNPFLKSSVEDALGLAKSAFAGQYGGAAGGNLDNSGYQEALARNLGKVATSAYSDAYQSERQNQLNAMQLSPSLGNLDAGLLAQVGAQNEALGQSQFSAPWENLRNYQAMLSGNFGGTTSTQSPFFTNPAANALGLGIGGMQLFGLGRQIFGNPGVSAPMVQEMVPGQFSLANPAYG